MAPVAKIEYATSPDLPSPMELAQAAQMRADCKAEIEALTCKADDVIGDLRLCRFLRSRHGDVKTATEWFKGFLQWRVTSKMDLDRREVVGRSPEDFLDWYEKRRNPYLPICPYAGRNADGHVLWYIRQGLVDAKKFVEHRQYPMEEDLRTICLCLEWTLWYVDTLSRKEGRMVYCVKFSDFAGLGAGGRKLPFFVPEFKSFITQMVSQMQQNYCEHDSLFVLVNTPFAFRAMWSVVKALLTKRQSSKIRMLGDTSSADVVASIREVIQDNVLPTEYGGKLARAVGAFPAVNPADCEAWYKTRHLVKPEFVKEKKAWRSA
eukprot:gnl/TRDRNA2_/TRDRNA2_175482_c0_seq1.p1 gnl/TRDRNA2_/TRDRNA2_175482_c0~~gnl/TRDRNA2_/TRDRNA2_175482_c0_seq1.p1  ORF type:complete len:320 (+),score=51.64 gnl/TRDRNA2_/TRDRNA2_175482_c0_seq1:67-1026(+)